MELDFSQDVSSEDVSKLRNFKKILEMARFNDACLADHKLTTYKANFNICARKLPEISCKALNSHRKICFI